MGRGLKLSGTLQRLVYTNDVNSLCENKTDKKDKALLDVFTEVGPETNAEKLGKVHVRDYKIIILPHVCYG